jgi:hypothetical protein
MTMKSVLLGAAAGIATVSVAQAADLPMTKAEAVEYVKVCSEFGPGFFYIPGTDTCLKISGNARADYSYGTANKQNRILVNGVATSRAVDQTAFQSRTEIQFDARTQTDYGLLRSFLSINAVAGHSNNQTWAYGGVSGSTLSVDKAFIQFGGLTAGYAESQYAYFDNYFGDDYFGPYYGSGGIGTKDQLAYTAQFGGGFSATLSLEDPKGTQAGVVGVKSAGTQSPDIIGNIHVEQEWGSAQVMAVAHQVRTLSDPTDSTAGHSKWGFAVGAGGSIKFPLLSGGYIASEFDYAEGASDYTGTGNNSSSPAGAPATPDAFITASGSEKLAKSWSVSSEAGLSLTPQWTALVFGSYGHFDSAGGLQEGFKDYVAGAQLKYEIVKNFTIGAEVYYAATRGQTNAVNLDAEGNTLAKRNTSAWVGGIRVRRDF